MEIFSSVRGSSNCWEKWKKVGGNCVVILCEMLLKVSARLIRERAAALVNAHTAEGSVRSSNFQWRVEVEEDEFSSLASAWRSYRFRRRSSHGISRIRKMTVILFFLVKRRALSLNEFDNNGRTALIWFHNPINGDVNCFGEVYSFIKWMHAFDVRSHNENH